MMHWYDWMTLVIVVGGAIIQTVRGNKAGGMGLPLFETAGLLAGAGIDCLAPREKAAEN